MSEADTVIWSKDGSILHSNSDFKQMFDGTKARLEVVEVFLDDCGTYTCTIKNLEGEKKCSCKVCVKGKNFFSCPKFVSHHVTLLMFCLQV